MSREDEVRSLNSRRRNLLYLVEKYLLDNGLTTSAASVRNEARLIPEYEICDNIDLDSIYLEYASYFHVKFGKYPRVLKKAQKPIKLTVSPSNKKINVGCKKEEIAERSSSVSAVQPLEDSLKISPMASDNRNQGEVIAIAVEPMLDRCDIFSTPEWKELTDVIKSTIIKKSYGLQWKDILGNSNAVKILKEAVVVPLKMPHLFNDSLKPWKSVLMHGPPGTGKTMLAKVLCSEVMGSVTFFNITSSILTSKWRGESEKIIKILFQMARFYAPSVIFIDEIEGLTSQRDRISDHEASKRFKNEFLQQLDGMEDRNGIFFMASTNLPWEIDAAFLRRFEKKILVQLPNYEERCHLLKSFLGHAEKWDNDILESVSKKCEDFTGDEIRIACKEVAMKQISKIDLSKGGHHLERAEDVMDMFEKLQPVGHKQMIKFEQWQKKFELF